jgi:hypothetical protein
MDEFENYKVCVEKLNKALEVHKEEFASLKRSEENLVKSVDDKKYVHEYMKKMKLVSNAIEELESVTGGGFEHKVMKVFRTVFKNIRSQTKELMTLEEGDSKSKVVITIGSIGFGFRRNGSSRSKEVVWADDIALLLGSKAEVVKALNGMKLPQWADKFERFAEVVPIEALKSSYSDSADYKMFELSKPIILTIDEGDVDDHEALSKSVLSAYKISFRKRYSESEIVLYDEKGEVLSETLDCNHGLLGDYDIVAWMQIRDEIDKHIEEFVAYLKPQIAQAKTTIDELNDKFGREILLSEL